MRGLALATLFVGLCLLNDDAPLLRLIIFFLAVFLIFAGL
jgi:hypothetical protein